MYAHTYVHLYECVYICTFPTACSEAVGRTGIAAWKLKAKGLKLPPGPVPCCRSAAGLSCLLKQPETPAVVAQGKARTLHQSRASLEGKELG